MNMYAVALMARREGILRVKSGIVVAVSDDYAGAEALNAAHEALPESDGWAEWECVVGRMASPMVFGEYKLVWQVTHDQ